MSDGTSGRKARPVSTMALDFSQQLDGLFNLGGEIPTLMSGIEERKQSVNNSNRELEELEARIKAMEERLSQNGVGSAPPASQKATDAASNLAAPATSTFHASRPSSSARPDLPTSAPPPPPGRAPPVPTANGPPLRAPPGRPAAGTAGYIPRMPSNISESSSLRDRGEYGVAH